MKTLVTGSIAFDKIMMFSGKFGDHILPTKTHSINVAFHIPTMRSEHGGTGANIAYALASLGDQPLLIGAVGNLDSAHYVESLAKRGVDTSMLKHVQHSYCAQANIMTDTMNNQITAFHPGAMTYAAEIDVASILRITEARGDTLSKIAIVSPDDKIAMISHCNNLHKSGVDFIFDPGQALPLFNEYELKNIIAKAYAITLNDYEADLLTNISGMQLVGDNSVSEALAANGNGGLVVTRGKDGVDFYQHGKDMQHIPIANVTKIVDPTGCGDAFRAGLLYVLARDRDWEFALKVGVCTGGIQVQYHGAQNHNISRKEVLSLGESSFGVSFVQKFDALDASYPSITLGM